MSAGIDAQRWRAGGVKLGKDSVLIAQCAQRRTIVQKQQELLLTRWRGDKTGLSVKLPGLPIEGVGQTEPCVVRGVREKKRARRSSEPFKLVEPAGIEPASASPPQEVLHT